MFDKISQILYLFQKLKTKSPVWVSKLFNKNKILFSSTRNMKLGLCSSKEQRYSIGKILCNPKEQLYSIRKSLCSTNKNNKRPESF